MTSGDLKLAAMTVNERLVHAGLLDAFDAAARARDRIGMVNVLVKAGFSEEQANATATQLLRNPRMYGY